MREHYPKLRILVRAHGYDERFELQEIGLSVPAVTRVFMLLRGRGYDVGENAYTVEQARDRLLPLLKKEGAAHA